MPTLARDPSRGCGDCAIDQSACRSCGSADLQFAAQWIVMVSQRFGNGVYINVKTPPAAQGHTLGVDSVETTSGCSDLQLSPDFIKDAIYIRFVPFAFPSHYTSRLRTSGQPSTKYSSLMATHPDNPLFLDQSQFPGFRACSNHRTHSQLLRLEKSVSNTGILSIAVC